MANQAQTIALYSRKSRFTGKGESIGNQVELCKEYVRLHFGEQATEQLVIYETVMTWANGFRSWRD